MHSVVRRALTATAGLRRAAAVALLAGALAGGCEAVRELLGEGDDTGEAAADSDDADEAAEAGAEGRSAAPSEAEAEAEAGAAEDAGDAELAGDAGGTASAGSTTAALHPPAPPDPQPQDAGDCPEGEGDLDIGVLVSPRRAVAGEPARIIVATLGSEDKLAVRLEVDGAPHEDVALTHRRGVPAATIARTTLPAEGKRLRVIVGREGAGVRCHAVTIHARALTTPRPRSAAGVWPVARKWSAGEEALFSAWVREMFHAPRGEDLAWSALHEVTSDADRNLLRNHHAWNEDDLDTTRTGLFLRPDCADAPYFLRAYYAWKRGLPFGFRACSRGRGGRAPACGSLRDVLGEPEHPPDAKRAGEVGAVQKFFRRTLAWGVHTGNGRTAFGDDDTDFYPLALSRRALRPGSIYADPYGHIFVLVELMDPEGADPGVLYAIDGQPDGSITRKRFWEGNFLWNPDPSLGGSGFKAFRPLDVVTVAGERVTVAANDGQITTRAGYGDVSDEQSTIEPEAFYDRMDALITPGVRDAARAQSEAIVALSEAAKVRVTSVDNGEAHLAGGGRVIDMPSGHKIFETTGAWENYSTPARDLRLLIAIDVATSFGDKVARNPSAYGITAADVAGMRGELDAARDERLRDPALAITYTRSNGTPWTLTLEELVARADALEVGYNPNDCPELRWGAAEGSEERSTCRRRAPADQQRKVAAYRMWFDERRRPARGDPGPPVP